MKRVICTICLILIFLIGGCISNPRIDGISLGAMLLKVDVNHAGEINEIVPIVLVNIKGDK